MFIFVVLFAFIILLLLYAWVSNQSDRLVKDFIHNDSKLYKEIQSLNNKYDFNYYLPYQFQIKDICPNKRAFDRYDYNWKMLWKVGENRIFFENLILEAHENKLKWQKYLDEYNNISSFTKETEIKNRKISYKKIEKVEHQLYSSLKLKKPTIRVEILYSISYTSPKGYSHYSDEKVFYEADLLSIFEKLDLNEERERKKAKKRNKSSVDAILEKVTKYEDSPHNQVTLEKGKNAVENQTELKLSDEQNAFILSAKKGENILVEACVGSGKTTAIQHLCNELSDEYKILYLTYNRLLKIDAQQKILNPNVKVTNYHGFAFGILKKAGIKTGRSDSVSIFNKKHPSIEKYDVLIVDEYQDIELETSKMLEYIKSTNEAMQIIMVGDMCQKIYDKTTLDVACFVNGFLGQYKRMEFTNCFRLSQSLASQLGEIWGKPIKGVNDSCIVEKMSQKDVVLFLSQQNPKDVLCLGARSGDLTDTLNHLETCYSDAYNKKTVYASIRDEESAPSALDDESCAIFTTYDSCKGLERKICVVFDFTYSYWCLRNKAQYSSYDVLRNVFCVAASRGKERIVFVDSGEPLLDTKTLKTEIAKETKYKDVSISAMFDFMYKEDIEECFSHLKITKKITNGDCSIIDIKRNDDLIDLSPCIGIYQEAYFFDNYDIDEAIRFQQLFNNGWDVEKSIKEKTIEYKVPYLVSLETKQMRYCTQVKFPFVSPMESDRLRDRLQAVFNRTESVQVACEIPFFQKGNENVIFWAKGLMDVVKNNSVYELKYVTELSHEHFLQCACYVIASRLKKGYLWNTRDNLMYEITIPDRKAFLDSVTRTITKRTIDSYYGTNTDIFVIREAMPISVDNTADRKQQKTDSMNQTSKNNDETHFFAVLDVETNWNDEAMSIGVVVANKKTYTQMECKYYLIDPEYRVGGLYDCGLKIDSLPNEKICNRNNAIEDIIALLQKYNVNSIFAYNGCFDLTHLGELGFYNWYDIMKIAAYKQYNSKIPKDAEVYKSGRLKKDYGAEKIYIMLSGKKDYCETHNALQDSIDELEIMRLLNLDYDIYQNARIENKK